MSVENQPPVGPPDGYVRSHFSDPAENHIGPFFERAAGDEFRGVLLTRAQHCNSMGNINGGVLLAFADFCFSAAGRRGGDANEHCVTVNLDAQFMAGGRIDEAIYGEAEIMRRTRSMVFVRGRLFAVREGVETNLLSFSGVGKRTWHD